MKKASYKFELKDRVFVVGKAGICVISGRGKMDFISGGVLNIYQIEGGQEGYYPEYALLTVQEMKAEVRTSE